jgi:RNA polymerase sigma factor (sigma-70 family)
MITTRKQTGSPLEQMRRKRRVEMKRSSTTSGPRRGLTRSEERTLRHLLTHEQDFIDSPDFYVKGAEETIYSAGDDIRKPDVSWYHPLMDDLSPTKARSASAGDQVLLTAAQERVPFLKFNYARYRIRELQREIWATPDQQPTDEQAADLLRWERTARELREQIANTNLALVLAMAKRTRMSEVDFADLVSEGNMALLRAVDKFDCGRGFKFSTYACRAILKAFSRQGMKLSKHRQRFPTDFDPKFEKSDYLETKRRDTELDAADEVKRIVLDNRADLSDIERTVIDYRFGVEAERLEKPMTLEQIGQIIGVTKERVRQIQNKALEKIRVELEESYMAPGEGEDEKDALSKQAALN